MPNLLLSGSERESMWQEEATLQTDVGHWNVLYPNPFESCIENAFGSVTAAQIKPDCKPLITGNTLGEFSWRTAAGLIQSPPSLASEGSCTTSPSECPGSPYKSCPSENLVQEKSRRMNNPVPSASGHHVIDDDPDGTSPPVSVNNWWTSMLLPTTTQSHTSPSSSAIPDLDALNWSSDAAEQLSHSKAIATAYSTITADCHQHMDAGSSTLLDSSLSTGSNMGGVTDSSVWSQVLLGSASSEAMQSLHNCSVEGLPDLLYSRTIRQSNEFLLSDHLKRIEDIPPWDSTLKNFTFQGDDMNLSTLEKSTPTLQYPHLVDDRLSSTCTLPDMETWSATQDHNNAVSQSGSLTPFSSGLHLGSSHFEAIRVKQEHPLSYSCSMQSATSPSSHFESIRVKQEHPLSYSCPIPTATSPFWLQGFGVDYKGDMVSSQLMECENKPLFKSLAATSNLAGSSLGEEFLGRWSSAHSSMFPTAALQQTLTSGPAGAMSKQPVQMLAYGNSVNRHTLDLSNPRPDVKHQMHVPAIDRSSSLHYGHRTFDSKQFDSKPLHEPPSNWRTLGHAEEPRDPGPDTKRNVGSINGGDSSSEACFKRPRAEQAPATLPFKQQVRKEKLGDRITALQQLVSPFGKTDTASVLLEAIGYIKFLQEQVQVLSTPYMKSASTTTNQNENQDTADEPKQDLRSRGLCLVPVSCTLHVANDNGADYWAPSLGGGYR